MNLTINTDRLHPATASCIEALKLLSATHKFTRILDMGCGSGILSIISAGLWNAGVLAVDVSQEAVAETQRQIIQHQMSNRVQALRSDGFSEKTIGQRAPYDLIIFNLLAEPIARMAPQVKQHLANDGVCILSGILAWLADDVERAYSRLGFRVVKTFSNSPWMTFILQK